MVRSSQGFACTRKGTRGFTLVELLIAVAILSVFLFWVYQLFIGGTKTANKAGWISAIVDQLRNGTGYLSLQLKSSSYPTTLLADTILDPSDSSDKALAQEYFVKILRNGTDIKAPTSGEQLVMKFVVCEPEKPGEGKPGQLTEFKLMFLSKQNTLVQVGDLRMDSETFKFTTAAPNYAKAGKVSLTPVPGTKKQYKICTDVEKIQFEVDPSVSLPTEPTDFKFINIKIHCVFPKDPKTYKDNSIMITPNVGISLL